MATSKRGPTRARARAKAASAKAPAAGSDELAKRARDAKKFLEQHLRDQPPPRDMGLIVQYVSVAPSPRDPQWICVAFSCGPLLPIDEFPYEGPDDPAIVAAARKAVLALVEARGWTLVNSEPAFDAQPAANLPEGIRVTWWIHM